MSNDDTGSVERLFAAMKNVQINARCVDDVARGLVATAHLWRAASYQLGHMVDEAAYEKSAVINEIALEDLVIVRHDNHKSSLDKYHAQFKITSFFQYTSDATIDIEFVANQIAELGMFFDESPVTAAWPSSRFSEEFNLYLSPAKWPFVASALFLKMHQSDLFKFQNSTVNMLLQDFYPHTSHKALLHMFDADLITDARVLCDFLLANENIALENPAVSLPGDLKRLTPARDGCLDSRVVEIRWRLGWG